jgi:hypothetical protein
MGPTSQVTCDSYQLIFTAGDVGNFHVVSRRRQILQFLAGKDVDSDKVDLGVTVLASLGSGHFDDLAWAALDDDEPVLPQRRTLHGVGGRGASIGAFEGVLVLSIWVSLARAMAEFKRRPGIAGHER